ncbi:hypothetical protein D9V86_11655, partial [Bacteroidetes/Chlorobi group bacterium ChocPot_Mid]
DKINKAAEEYNEKVDKVKEINHKKSVFLGTLEGDNFAKLSFFGTLCFAALLFDYFVNSRTLIWIPHALGTSVSVYVFAFIFSIFDGIIAVLASGLFAKNMIGFVNQRRIWLSLLWSLGAIKAILFVVFIKFELKDSFAGSNLMIFIQLCFIALIYAILHFAGKGIYYSLKTLSYGFLIYIWHDPNEKKKKNRKGVIDLDNKISLYKFNKNEVYNHFQINIV